MGADSLPDPFQELLNLIDLLRSLPSISPDREFRTLLNSTGARI